MGFRKVKIGLLVLWSFMIGISGAYAQLRLDDKHVNVALRMVGHQMLLHAGDSTSRVLPVGRNGDSYELKFEAPIKIEPNELVQVMDSVVKQTNIAKSYLVEILNCDSKEVLYSYEIGGPEKMDIIPCRGRELPLDCYVLSFTILELPLVVDPPNFKETNVASTQPQGHLPMAVSAALLIIITVLWFYFRKNPTSNRENPNMISLGAFDFDTLNMVLLHQGQKTELTSKESDLLLLLYNSANSTLDRDTILNKVWGDEGDYVGRTLDVFISKLRKKLEGDTNLKIVNVRGVGYKLILNE
ncbi:winged helix-turn-helix domain-containing protein [Owenweeksia hongkongensis]|uniref:winged helix-turn-helix domain-containing protein n=1 Tax=Owenweeksia hongkongensis TaxID=253245 RepID=UPI003A90EC84